MYNLAGFFKNMDYDEINYCGCGLTVINLKLGMQVVDTYTYGICNHFLVVLIPVKLIIP